MLDVDSGDIIAHVMTEQGAGDASQVEPLLDQIDMPIGKFTADGAYDGEPIYAAVPITVLTQRWLSRRVPVRWIVSTTIRPVNEPAI